MHIASLRWVARRAGCLIGVGLPNAQLSLARNATAAELRVLGLAIATTSGKINTKPFRVHLSSEARLAKLTASHDVSYDRRCRL